MNKNIILIIYFCHFIFNFFRKNNKQKITLLGIGDWGLGIGPNPQSPIPNPQSPIPNKNLLNKNPKNYSLIK